VIDLQRISFFWFARNPSKIDAKRGESLSTSRLIVADLLVRAKVPTGT
jgi:hypothetical protein